jgi:hypothetical protein
MKKTVAILIESLSVLFPAQEIKAQPVLIPVRNRK